MLLQLLFVLIAIIIGARLGGIGLGVLGGLGLGHPHFRIRLGTDFPSHRCNADDRCRHRRCQLHAGSRRTGPDGEVGGKIAAQESLQDYAL